MSELTVQSCQTFIAGSQSLLEEAAWQQPDLLTVCELDWQQHAQAWSCSFSFPAKTLQNLKEIVPCFSSSQQQSYGYRFSFEGVFAGEKLVQALSAVGSFAACQVPSQQDFPESPMVAEIDTLVIKTALQALRVTLVLTADSNWNPEEQSWLLSLSCRYGAPTSKLLSPEITERREIELPASSQMVIPEIGERICSPTSVSMVVSGYGCSATPQQIAESAYCQEHDMYGVWPWNIYATSHLGVLGFISFFSTWQQAAGFIDLDIPLITSIRFGAGELTGALAPRSGPNPLGHLVVLRGYEPGRVLVHDPAAGDDAGVALSYDLDEFLHVWLTRSAIAYILLNPSG